MITCDINLKKKNPGKPIACGETVSRDFLHEVAAGQIFQFRPLIERRARAPFIPVFIRQYRADRVYRVPAYCTQEIKIAMHYSGRNGLIQKLRSKHSRIPRFEC